MYAGLIFGTLILEEFKIHFLAWFTKIWSICVVEWQKGSSAGTIEVYQRDSHSLFIYAMPTKWCMHAEWHKYYVDIKFWLNLNIMAELCFVEQIHEKLAGDSFTHNPQHIWINLMIQYYI